MRERRSTGTGAAIALALWYSVACYGGEAPASGEAEAGQPPPSAATTLSEAPAAALSDEEAAEGWRLLFNGADLDGWRGYGMDRPPAGWTAEDGALRLTPGVESGDLLTVERFADFELRLEWKLEAGGNSGVFFHVVEDYGNAYESGPEMQVLDNSHPDGSNPLTSSGSNFALHAPEFPILVPVGEWNEIRIRVVGPRVEQWLNGGKVVDYELWTDEWKALVASSKFADMPGYGLSQEGHIVLQNHGDPVWYRDVRIRVPD